MLRIIAYFFSIVFHPLLMLTYMLVLLLVVNPYLFAGIQVGGSIKFVLRIFLSSFVIPAFAVGMMKALDMIESFEMKSKSERIGPYIITGILYMWLFQNLLNNPEIPGAFKIFLLGATLGLFMAFFFNLFTKISMHALGMGGLLGMTILTMLLFSYETFTINIGPASALEISMSALLMLVILLTGVVCTSRLILGAHSLQDLYSGFIIGLATQFIAFQLLV
ncbi:MAG: hypothetical protein AB8F74_02085 [Saprospiraceae bacterium]